MPALSRRKAIALASSFALASFGDRKASAQAVAGALTVEMASFLKGGGDADAAFAKAIAEIEKAATEAAKGGGPVHIVFDLEKNATYRIKRPLAFKQLHGFELNGNGAQLVNATRDSTLTISSSSHVTVRDLAIDYDPLPFTQGTIAA